MTNQDAAIKEYSIFLARAYQLNNVSDPLANPDLIKNYLMAESEHEKRNWFCQIHSKVTDGLKRIQQQSITELHRNRLRELEKVVISTTSFTILMTIVAQVNFIFSIWNDASTL
ncbi:MAG TPA: hypothetical protein VK179_14695 [Bacteroidales bacterium]|nr:hypothetical protein [Bacteroidales bacterium]